MRTTLAPIIALLALLACPLSTDAESELPVRNPEKLGLQEAPSAGVRNPLTFRQIHANIGADGRGLRITLQDPDSGEVLDDYNGTIYSGPYPFEADHPRLDGGSDYDYARYRASARLQGGTGVIPVSRFFRDRYNANDWVAGEEPSPKTVAFRLDLYRNGRHFGFYGSRVSFRARRDDGLQIEKAVTIV